MSTVISREDLEVAARAGNGWARQEMLRRFGTVPERGQLSTVDSSEYDRSVQEANSAARLDVFSEGINGSD